MLILISEATSNSNTVIRQEFRKLRFQMIDNTRELTPLIPAFDKGEMPDIWRVRAKGTTVYPVLALALSSTTPRR